MKNTSARFELRLELQDKARIAGAAILRRMTVSAFVRSAALDAADGVLSVNRAVTLSRSESQRFLTALDSPFRPNARLREAMGAATLRAQR